MELNKEIARWFNDIDILHGRFSRRNFSALLNTLSQICNFTITSVAQAYEQLYFGEIIRIKKLPAPRLFSNDGRSNSFLRPLFELREYIEKNLFENEIVGFYVHGSLSTNDYIRGYSDFDTLVIVRRNVIDNPDWAIDFKRRLYKTNTFLILLDPLQHHSHFILTEYDLDHYYEPIFPTVLFEYSSELTNFRNDLFFQCHDDQIYLERIFSDWHDYFKNPKAFGFKYNSAYSVKQFVQSILLAPTIYLQIKTRSYNYKKYSFEEAKNDIDPDVWQIVERATKVRLSSPFISIYPYWFRKKVGLYLHYRLLHLIHRFCDRNNAKYMIESLGPNFEKCALELWNTMRNNLNKPLSSCPIKNLKKSLNFNKNRN